MSKEEEPICCVGCGKDGVFPENRDGDTMCESCHSDGEEEEWCECSFCGDELTEEKSEMVGDYCVCYDCYLKSIIKIDLKK